MDKNVEYYMGLPYTIELIPDKEAGWFVRVKELRGCMSQGDTAQEALEMIQDAQRGWLEVAIEDGIPIPEPQPDEEYSGKFVVRVPRSLHRALAERAEREDASLNQYINVALARAVGQEKTVAPQLAVAQDVAWPGLKASVRQVLLDAGMAEDAGELDEQVFASWATARLAQAADLSSRGDPVSSAACLNSLTAALEDAGRDSPVLAVLQQAVTMLSSQMNASAEDLIKAQIADIVDKAQRLAQSRTSAAGAHPRLTAPEQERIIDLEAFRITSVPETTLERSYRSKKEPVDARSSRSTAYRRLQTDKEQPK